jgi:hypothetical protein
MFAQVRKSSTVTEKPKKSQDDSKFIKAICVMARPVLYFYRHSQHEALPQTLVTYHRSLITLPGRQ